MCRYTDSDVERGGKDVRDLTKLKPISSVRSIIRRKNVSRPDQPHPAIWIWHTCFFRAARPFGCRPARDRSIIGLVKVETWASAIGSRRSARWHHIYAQFAASRGEIFARDQASFARAVRRVQARGPHHDIEISRVPLVHIMESVRTAADVRTTCENFQLIAGAREGRTGHNRICSSDSDVAGRQSQHRGACCSSAHVSSRRNVADVRRHDSKRCSSRVRKSRHVEHRRLSTIIRSQGGAVNDDRSDIDRIICWILSRCSGDAFAKANPNFLSIEAAHRNQRWRSSIWDHGDCSGRAAGHAAVIIAHHHHKLS